MFSHYYFYYFIAPVPIKTSLTNRLETRSDSHLGLDIPMNSIAHSMSFKCTYKFIALPISYRNQIQYWTCRPLFSFSPIANCTIPIVCPVLPSISWSSGLLWYRQSCNGRETKEQCNSKCCVRRSFCTMLVGLARFIPHIFVCVCVFCLIVLRLITNISTSNSELPYQIFRQLINYGH